MRARSGALAAIADREKGGRDSLPLHVRQLLEGEQQRMISEPAVSLRLERHIKLTGQRKARHGDPHSAALIECDTEVLLEVLDEKSWIEIPVHHLRREIVENPALCRTFAD